MKDTPFKTCPEDKCQVSPWGHGEVKRLLGTGAGLIFKGSGFYITDYRSEGYKSAAKKDSAGGEKKESKVAGSPGASSPAAPSAPAKPAPGASSGGGSK
jgi:predicted nucleic acid-binding Zn ribbon protein